MLEELQRRNLSKLTAESHVRVVEEFSRYHRRAPDQLGPEQIRQYQAHLFTDRKLDANTVAQHLSALRFFFIKTLKRNWSVEETPYPKRPIRLPDVLSREEVERLIDSADSRLHRICGRGHRLFQPTARPYLRSQAGSAAHTLHMVQSRLFCDSIVAVRGGQRAGLPGSRADNGSKGSGPVDLQDVCDPRVDTRTPGGIGIQRGQSGAVRNAQCAERHRGANTT